MTSDEINITEKHQPIPPVIVSAPDGRGRLAHFILPILYLLGDLGGVYGSFILAYQLRFYADPILHIFPLHRSIPDLSSYLDALTFVCAVMIFIFAIFGNYLRRSPSIFDRFYETARAISAGIFIIMATTFFYRTESFSRLMLIFAWAILIVIVWLIRELIYDLEKWYLRRGWISRRAVIVGDGERGIALYKKLMAQPGWGIVPVGFVCDSEIDGPCLGKLAELDEIIKSYSLDLVIFNLAHNGQDFIVDYVLKNDNLRLEYMIAPDMIGLLTFNAESVQIEGIPVLRWGKTPIEGYSRAVKRIFDMVFAGFGIVAASPVFIGVALAVKLDSPGPILFKQKRIGRNGRKFTMYKFRSMCVDNAGATGAGWTVKDDPRRTRVGKFIRRSNLDELPQLFNVLFGQMSLVGPRPEQPGYVEKFRDDIPRYFQRHKVKSGVTGWAQVNGFRGDTSISDRTKYDLYYVENWSLIFDIKIIFLTLKNIFRSPNAY